MPCILTTLTDPTRRTILRSLRGGALSADALADHAAASRRDLTDHLRALRRAGLLQEERSVDGACYALRREPLRELAAFLRTVAAQT